MYVFQFYIEFNKIKFQKKIWHTILVSIFRSYAFMRVDDGKHRNKTVKFNGELNFDAMMSVGWDKHRTKENGMSKRKMKSPHNILAIDYSRKVHSLIHI